jgi:hypothetical protein
MIHLKKRSFPALAALFPLIVLTVAALMMPGAAARAGEREDIERFLEITGFDAALDSISFSAESAPDMLGLDPGAFGADWRRLSGQVFDREVMRAMALEILTATLDRDMLDHAVGFYATDLGQRLVKAENASHLDEDDEARQYKGRVLADDLKSSGETARLETYHRMLDAIDASSNGIRAWQEIQVRFLLTAGAAGVIELKVDEQGLRNLLAGQEDELKEAMRVSGLAAAAWTYRGFSTEELDVYVQALTDPLMQKVYELLNAVQYEITANRFEVLAVRMAKLHPVEDI